MQKSHWAALAAVVVLIVVAFVAIRGVYYGGGSSYVAPERELTTVSLEQAAPSDWKAAEVENPAEAKGVAVVDFAHDNALFVHELNTLYSGLVSRGYSYEIVTPELNEQEGEGLIDRLEYASALIVPLPRATYTAAEIAEVRRFVANGGQVLIIGDPTRTIDVDALNSVAGSFGIIYPNDYLYSLNESSIDNNYRNVIYTNFVDSPLTEGLANGDKVIFYSGSSVTSPGNEIILGDDTTFSSTSEAGRAMASAVLAENEQVLALGDLTFFSEPYSAAESNGVLINNIANFLTAGQRSYDLRDFPYFFNDNINVVFDNSRVFNSQFPDAVRLKEMLEAQGRSVTFTDEIGADNDIIFIGRFEQTDAVQDYLTAANIVILDPVKEEDALQAALVSDPAAQGADAQAPAPKVGDAEEDEEQDQDFIEGRIRIEGVGDLERGGSTLFHRAQTDDGRNVLIILSDNPDTNADAFDLLMEGEIETCLAGPDTAVCQTEDPDKKLPPSLRSTRIDKILVVADDSGRAREDARTSLAEFNTALGDTYNVTEWLVSADGSPSLAELQEYDAVIWTTGDYWDDSINSESAEVLAGYIEAGGNLILSGASIAFDWDHTDFVQDIVHADYLTFAEQQDVEVVQDDHPIANGWAAGDVFTFTPTLAEEPVQPDVVAHTRDARVVLTRGPESQQSGAAAVIAFEDDRSKIAYFAFPVYLLSPETQTALIDNTVDWFTRRPLELPDEDDYIPYETTSDQQVGDEGEETGLEGEEAPPADGEDQQQQDENGDGNGDDTGNGDEEEENGSGGEETTAP